MRFVFKGLKLLENFVDHGFVIFRDSWLAKEHICI